jgi:hypothetical protein
LKKSIIFWLCVILAAIVLYGLADPAKVPFPKCPFRSITGLLCPGCGSQRGIHQLLCGNVGAAFRLNALLIPTILYGLTGAVMSLFFPKHWAEVREKYYGATAGYIVLAIILVYWVGRNIY